MFVHTKYSAIINIRNIFVIMFIDFDNNPQTQPETHKDLLNLIGCWLGPASQSNYFFVTSKLHSSESIMLFRNQYRFSNMITYFIPWHVTRNQPISLKYQNNHILITCSYAHILIYITFVGL